MDPHVPKPSLSPLSLAPSKGEPSVPKRTRRSFTAAEKLRIVQAADACTERGQLEALLRREALYSSHLTKWRKALALGGQDGLRSAKPGRKRVHTAEAVRITALEAKNARLEKQLALAQELLALQKKVSHILGIALPTSETP
jgi:transposase